MRVRASLETCVRFLCAAAFALWPARAWTAALRISLLGLCLSSVDNSLCSSVAERQSCKLKVLGSIPSEGLMACLQDAGCSLSFLWQQVVASLFVASRLVANKLYISSSNLMMAKKANISCKS